MLAREKYLESLLELSQRSAAGSRADLMARILRLTLELTTADGAVLQIAHNRVFERWVLRPGEPRPETALIKQAGSELVRSLARCRQPIVVPDFAGDLRLIQEDGCPGVDVRAAVFVPLRLREHVSGYLAAYRGAGRWKTEDVRHATFLAALSTLAFENQRLSESVEKLAVTDDLTQVYNYRFLKTALRREVKRAGRFGQQLSLVMIDVDNLKSYNDRNGHLRGSFLLKEIAGLFVQQTRSWDLVAKYGGDEFTIILPQTGREGAMVVGERMRAAVASHTFPLTTCGSITISSGVALFPDDAAEASSLIAAADRMLYQAKRNGRNRVEGYAAAA
jgi:diguanylate cyclase (GGDEF)-like protein